MEPKTSFWTHRQKKNTRKSRTRGVTHFARRPNRNIRPAPHRHLFVFAVMNHASLTQPTSRLRSALTALIPQALTTSPRPLPYTTNTERLHKKREITWSEGSEQKNKKNSKIVNPLSRVCIENCFEKLMLLTASCSCSVQLHTSVATQLTVYSILGVHATSLHFGYEWCEWWW